MTRPGSGVPEEPAAAGPPAPAEEPGGAPGSPVPHGSASVEPLPDPQDLEREATAQRNKDALAQLGRTVAGVTRSAADTAGTAARDAAARTAESAGAVRDQVAERVADVAERAAGPEPAGEGVVVAGPGLPTGTGSRTFRAADLPPDAVNVDPGSQVSPEASSVALPAAGAPTAGSAAGLQDSAREASERAAAAARDAGVRATAAAQDASSRTAGAARDAGDRATTSARDASDRAAAAAREASDRASAAAREASERASVVGQRAVVTGRAAVDQGSQAATAAGQEVAARARQAGQAAQQAGTAAQEAGAAALAQTRTAMSGAVASGVSAVRERTAAPIDVEGLAADVLALPGVARLAPDAAGRGRGLLPGQVAGAQVTDDEVTVRVVARYGVRLPQLAERVHQVARRYAEGRQTVVDIVDLELDDPSSPNDPDQRGTS